MNNSLKAYGVLCDGELKTAGKELRIFATQHDANEWARTFKTYDFMKNVDVQVVPLTINF